LKKIDKIAKEILESNLTVFKSTTEIANTIKRYCKELSKDKSIGLIQSGGIVVFNFGNKFIIGISIDTIDKWNEELTNEGENDNEKVNES